MTSTKRPRSASLSSSDTPPRSLSPAAKYARLPEIVPELASVYTSLVCTLPPTCSRPNGSTRLGSPPEVEEHYTKYHTHVCEYPKCRCVFPDSRFLELHITECHDPITQLRKERGENTFACFLGPSTCSRVFSTPKGRRLHLISVHNYPKQYFFGVVNKGIGGLLRKWGPAASLYRGEWKPRKELSQNKFEDNHKSDKSEMDVSEELDQRDLSREQGSLSNAKSPLQVQIYSDTLSIASSTNDTQSLVPDLILNDLSRPPQGQSIGSESNASLDDISLKMSSLSLVPDRIRFGRGGKKSGFVQPRHKHNSAS